MTAAPPTPTRKIPRFFPDSNNNSETDMILIDSGGMSTHRTITGIEKVGVNKEGNPINPPKKPHHYDFYQVEFNAGAGMDWADVPKYNPV